MYFVPKVRFYCLGSIISIANNWDLGPFKQIQLSGFFCGDFLLFAGAVDKYGGKLEKIVVGTALYFNVCFPFSILSILPQGGSIS